MSKESHKDLVQAVTSDPGNPVDHDSQPPYEQLAGIGEALRVKRNERRDAELNGYHAPKGLDTSLTPEELKAIEEEGNKLWEETFGGGK